MTEIDIARVIDDLTLHLFVSSVPVQEAQSYDMDTKFNVPYVVFRFQLADHLLDDFIVFYEEESVHTCLILQETAKHEKGFLPEGRATTPDVCSHSV